MNEYPMKTEVWETSDGETYTDPDEARNHQDFLNLHNACDGIFSKSYKAAEEIDRAGVEALRKLRDEISKRIV